MTLGAFLVTDNRVFNGPLGRSLALLTPLTRSAALHFAMLALLARSAALHFATLALLARSVHGLAHSLRSLPRGTVEILEYVFML